MFSSPRGDLAKAAWNLADVASRKCWQEPVYKKIYLFFVVFYLIRDYFKLEFPDHYLWAETFINYQGGFMRRGLLGELLYYAAPWVNPRFLALAACTAAFLVFLKLAYDRLSAIFDKLTTVILFITPAYFIFFVKDYGSFLRKDQFMNLLAIITVLATVKFLKRERGSLVAPAAIFCACFTLSFFIHEATVFYFTLPAWLLGLAFARQKRTLPWILLMGALFLAAGYVAVHWPGTAENARAIGAAWQKYVPDFAGQGALGYLGMPVSELMAETSQWHNNAVIIRSAIWGLFLALLPLAWICWFYRPLAPMREKFSGFMCLLLPLAAAGPWALPIFANDSGRHIALGCIQYILVLWAMADVLKLEPAKSLARLNSEMDNNARMRVTMLAAIILFGTSWTLMPWVPVGHSFVVLAGLPDLLVYLISS